ncbi:MAG: AAA family ATPase [Proteobacteria bacterium]|nr:AAA family ATPase [Pseudomonadota bacterium]
MKCPKCQAENREEAKFCIQCGDGLELNCPKCNKTLPPGAKFCDTCGQKLEEKPAKEKAVRETEGERKHVTVVFSDLSGYTTMSERLDPEEVREIISQIFGEIAQVVTKYEGFIEKFIGDAVMALFGVPKAHEDDPIRAIRAVREIHDLVESMSPRIETKTGEPLSMHTGINTGLVVTGEVDLEKGTHGVSGDTVNLASRLSAIARGGEIVVGPDTYHRALGYFTFEILEPAVVKGKAEPVQGYRVLSQKDEPSKIHRLHGIKADLIGRKVEMAQLDEAVQQLREGRGKICCISGDAGTGKSRLLEEFRANLDLSKIQWLEGHAYAYSQNIPYFPLIDLMNRAWQIDEGDSPRKVRGKIESAIERLIGKKEEIVPYVGSLYSLRYPQIEGVSPEFWKARLQDAVQAILGALAQRAPTVICLEDLHWADPSSLNLLRLILSDFRHPAMYLCVYRPSFNLFTSHQLSGMGKIYQEVRLQDLSSSEAQDMMESLLKTKNIPSELRRFVQDKVEGNPFYLEEVINALIESGTLARDDGTWKLTRSIGESDIPSTIHGVIAARLDRLEQETKRVLQEASVIGRAFLYEILKKITELTDRLDGCLTGLERLDLIRTRSLQPDLEYVFKHALTQEVVYNGLLKKERQEIHERIALVMEELFRDRLSEFSETLAFHFAQGQSIRKAVDYLVKAGEKSLGRYAVEESHQYFKEAFDLMSNKPDKTKEEEGLLIDLLIKWAYVFYYRGDYRGLTDLWWSHENLAESLNDKRRLGMFYAWLGFILWSREELQRSYEYLSKALRLGEEVGDQKVIGYACAWLTWACADLGRLDEALNFGEKALEISKSFESDQYLYFKSLAGMGHTYWYRGEKTKLLEAAKTLLDYGRRHSNVRSLGLGHLGIGYSHFLAGDFPSAIECAQRAVQVSVDPLYSKACTFMFGFMCMAEGRFEEAGEALQEVVDFSDNFGVEWIGTPARAFLGLMEIVKGRPNRGVAMIENGTRIWRENQRRCVYAMAECVLGRVYLQLLERKAPISPLRLVKNIAFLAKNIPAAGRKAENHFNKAIEIASDIGAKGTLGEAYFYLGLLYRARNKKDEAWKYLSEAMRMFEQCEAGVHLKEVKAAVESLGRESP